MEQYLSVKNINKYFGDFQALKNVSFDVKEGEFVCILGPSGCGKTTLLRVIAGLESQSEGLINQNNKDISLLPPDQRDFGIVFQSYALFPNLSVKNNISFGLKTRKQNKETIDKRVDELLKLVGLSDHINKFSAQLSGGEQQRVALARALAPSPGLLLLDEPLSALDAKVRQYLRLEIKNLQRKTGLRVSVSVYVFARDRRQEFPQYMEKTVSGNLKQYSMFQTLNVGLWTFIYACSLTFINMRVCSFSVLIILCMALRNEILLIGGMYPFSKPCKVACTLSQNIVRWHVPFLKTL